MDCLIVITSQGSMSRQETPGSFSHNLSSGNSQSRYCAVDIIDLLKSAAKICFRHYDQKPGAFHKLDIVELRQAT